MRDGARRTALGCRDTLLQPINPCVSTLQVIAQPNSAQATSVQALNAQMITLVLDTCPASFYMSPRSIFDLRNQLDLHRYLVRGQRATVVPCNGSHEAMD